MRGLMMDAPLMISSIIEHAARNYSEQQIVSRTVEGPIHRYTYSQAHARCKQLARALQALGVRSGDRVATLAWNGYRHFELYYAVSGMGAVCHMINPRLFEDQIAYIVNHAQDRFIFLDLTFVALVEQLAPRFEGVAGFVIMTDREHMPDTALPNAYCYEELLEAQPPDFEWPRFDEWTASSLCYTSGTTGNPKGVLYSHRSTVLHALSVLACDGVHIDQYSACLPVVPMFHVNAWGVPYAVPIAGGRLVFPGPRMDGKSLAGLINEEGVTDAWGVPTVWLGVLGHMGETGQRFARLRSVLIGGSAAPQAMIKSFREEYGVRALQGWGMTEMSPVGTVATLKPHMQDWPDAERYNVLGKQGRALYGVQMKIVGADGEALPHDGKAYGELLVRGSVVTSAYFNDEQASRKAFDADGWFRTGDVATIDPDGYMQIVDRTKDVIKSGGEWISSIDLENEAVAHPKVAEAAVVAVPHPKWGERPLLVLVKVADADLTREEIIEYLRPRVAKLWLPDDVVFVDQLPHTATGKLRKSALREQYKDYVLPARG